MMVKAKELTLLALSAVGVKDVPVTLDEEGVLRIGQQGDSVYPMITLGVEDKQYVVHHEVLIRGTRMRWDGSGEPDELDLKLSLKTGSLHQAVREVLRLRVEMALDSVGFNDPDILLPTPGQTPEEADRP